MGCVVLKRKDQIVPTELIGKILMNNPSCLGYMGTKNGEVVFENSNEPYTAERFDEDQADLIGHEVVLQFSNMPDKYNDDEIQPFSVLEVGGKCLLGVAIEGDIPSTHSESPRTGEFFLAHEYLTPKIAEMYEDAGNDLPKLLDRMRRPSFMKDLNNNIGPGSTVTFLAGDGQVLTFGHNNTLLEQDWGWASRSYGYGGATAAPEPVKKKGLGGALSGAAKAVVEKVTGSSAKPANEVPPVRTESATIVHNNTGVMMKPPPEMKTKNQKRSWYIEMVGFVPEGYKNNVEVLVPKEKIEIKDFATAAEVMSAETKPLPEGVHRVEQTKTAVISKDVRDNALPIAEPKPPIIPVEQKKAITGLMDRGKLLKIVDINSTEVIQPSTIEAFEKKHPNFFEQTGVDRAHVDRWTYEHLHLLSKTAPDALAVLAMTYRNESLKLGGQKKFSTAQQAFASQQPVKQQPKATNVPAKNTQTTTKTETVPKKKYAVM